MRHHLSPLQSEKHALRASMRERRRVQSVDATASGMMARVFLEKVQLARGMVVASYAAVHQEMDPTILNETLRERGHVVALPIIIGKGKPLIFRRYDQGDGLLLNPLGIPEPMSTASGVDPDVVLIPMLAFDAQKNRLGYGGGYYDRTIKKLRYKKPVLAIGVAYAFQKIELVPTGKNDVALDAIVTELGVF